VINDAYVIKQLRQIKLRRHKEKMEENVKNRIREVRVSEKTQELLQKADQCIQFEARK
jgi:hypothetical protein